MIEKFSAPGVFDPATYSQGIKVTQAQTILFLSGQVAYTADGGVAHRGDFKAQARGAYDAIKALVESQGGTMMFAIVPPCDSTSALIASYAPRAWPLKSPRQATPPSGVYAT